MCGSYRSAATPLPCPPGACYHRGRDAPFSMNTPDGGGPPELFHLSRPHLGLPLYRTPTSASRRWRSRTSAQYARLPHSGEPRPLLGPPLRTKLTSPASTPTVVEVPCARNAAVALSQRLATHTHAARCGRAMMEGSWSI